MKLWIALTIIPHLVFALVLEKEVADDLRLISIPSIAVRPMPEEQLDVAIIGGGQAGLATCLALFKQGVFNVKIFDKASKNQEGPWLTVARMKTLRTHKYVGGPSLDIPHLTFRAWYEASGYDFKALEKIPTPLWGEYLHWYREILSLPVENDSELLSIIPCDNYFNLLFTDKVVVARKVVLATGFDGCGGYEIPSFVENLPDTLWTHTGKVIDVEELRNRRLIVIGAGASAFDISRVALLSGAKKVDLLLRRAEIPNSTPFALFEYWPAFYDWNDDKKYKFIEKGFKEGIPPPDESVAYLQNQENFTIHSSTTILKASAINNQVELETSQGLFKADFLILGTGYVVDLSKVTTLSQIKDSLLLWSDVHPEVSEASGKYPYLGRHFQFLEKTPGTAPFLKNLYCYNAGGIMSHGFMVVNIDALPMATARLAEGIASDLFLSSFECP